MPLFTKLVRHPIAATTGAVAVMVLVQLTVGPATASTSSVGFQATVGGTTYLDAVAADNPTNLWRLNDTAAGTSLDSAGTDNLTMDASVTRGATGPMTNETSAATTFSGQGVVPAATSRAVVGPQSFSVEAWFKTTSTTGGKLIGLGGSRTGSSMTYDRHVYLTNAGNLAFGLFPTTYRTLTSAETYNNGQWHHVVATMDGAGADLFVDGRRVGSDTSTAGAQKFTGYWRVGGDNVHTWPNEPSSFSFTGSLADVAVYSAPLGLTAVQAHYRASGRTADQSVAPTDAYGAAVYGDHPSIYWRLDETTGTAAKDQVSGDPQSAGYSSGVVLGEAGSSAAPTGKSLRLPGDSVQTVVSNVQVGNPGTYSLETWFKTTSTQGGRLIGFGSARSGSSATFDRQIQLLDSGRVEYGINTGAAAPAVVDSPQPYNDGRWHHAVATQGAAGQQLFVDGALVATGNAVTPQDYTGYWRLGTDHTWAGSSSDSFAGSLDEVAIYPSVLSSSTVLQHYQIGAPANQAPVAALTSDCTGLACTFDGTGSDDPDGEIVAYEWDFGDLETAATSRTTHSYAEPGAYSVTLTVTDDRGATDVQSAQVTATTPNRAPVAAFSAQPTNLSAAFDASASADEDGQIASYNWDFGDGTTGTGVTPTHVYSAADTYPVTLVVTDNAGATGIVTHPVVATDRIVAADTFTRTVAGGLGNAETGGPWTVAGAAVSTSVADGSGRLQVQPARNNTYKLASTSSRDTDLVHTLWLEQAPSGSGASLSTTVRSTASGDYRVKLRVAPSGAMASQLVKVVGTAETTLTSLVSVPGGNLAVNQKLRIRVQAFGASPTTLRAKIWPVGTTEPATWLESVTDSSAGFQGAGSIGLASNLLGNFDTSVIRIDDLVATERTELAQ